MTTICTNDIDQRVRDHCAEEDAFLAERVAGTGLGPVTYRSLEGAGRVLLVALEPEDECGALFLRLRKGARAGGVRVAAVAPLITNGSRKLDAEVVLAAPGREADAVAALDRTHPGIVEALGADGAAILVGERAAAVYLAMSRVAHREGYPEIGLYWEKAAWEETEHAAKFAELLGEVVTDSTKKNLEMRVDAESGACAGKKALASMAKQQNLDAIHDTVHEMAKDEARHGKAFEGLLNRYFG